MKVVVRAISEVTGNLISSELARAGHTVLLISNESRWRESEFAGYTVETPEEWEKCAQDYDAFLLFAGPINCRSKVSRQRFPKDQSHIENYRNNARRLGIARFIIFSDFRNFLPRPDSQRDGNSCSRRLVEQANSGNDAERVYLGKIYSRRKNIRLITATHRSNPFGLFRDPFLSWLLPTTSVDQIINYLKLSVVDGSAQKQILTDPKSEQFGYRMWRVLLDSTFVTTVLLIAPLMLVVWLAVILESGRPGLFLQERLGPAGSVFKCVKLRTMKNGTPSAATHEVPGGSVTKLGSIFRRLKLDEVPQAWNILRGEMSLVGPRPCLPSQKEVILARDKHGVLKHRPGLTGWAQANGVDMREPELLAQYDGEYVGFQSAWFDLVILAKTLKLEQAKSR